MGGLFAKLIALGIAGGVIVGNQAKLEEFFHTLKARTQYVTTAADMRTITKMLDLHYMRKGGYPSEESFESWMRASFKESHLRDIMRDNWGHPFIYRTDESGEEFLLISAGPDGRVNTDDDLKNTGP
jgi:hypothetical protein